MTVETTELEETHIAEVLTEQPTNAEVWKETGNSKGHDMNDMNEDFEKGFECVDCFVGVDVF